MDASHAQKAAEAGELPPPPYPATPVPEKKPPLSKKCFLLLVIAILIGISVSIVHVLKVKKAAEAEAEFQRTSTTVTTTTTPALEDLSDEQILEKCKNKYNGVLGKSTIATFTGWNGYPEGIQKSGLWLTGNPTDEVAIKKAKVLACLEQIPTFVISMRPNGLRLFGEQNEIISFDDEPVHQTWDDYDSALESLLKKLKTIPSLVILEPKLLQLSYDVLNKQYEYDNNIYLDAFLERAQKVVNQLQKSWVYIDAGDPVYLNDEDHLNHVSATLLRVRNLRGFAMNTGFFANMTFVEAQARQIACQTGLNYVTDTGRNGGEFSRQELTKIAACRADPPNVKSSNKPMWGNAAMAAARAKTRSRRSGGRHRTETVSLNQDAYEQPQFRRFSLYRDPTPASLGGGSVGGGAGFNAPANRPTRISNAAPSGLIRSKAFNAAAPKLKTAGAKAKGPANKPMSKIEAEAKMAQRMRVYKVCIRPLNKNKLSDGYVWTRSNGESDGRLAKRGTASLCLKKHTVACDDTCPSNSQQSCNCEGKQVGGGGYGGGYGGGFGGGYAAGYPQMPNPYGYAPNPYAQQPWVGK